MSRVLNYFMSIALLSLSSATLALESDRHQAAEIEADQVTFDDARSIAVYQGNVRFTQGSLTIGADRMEVEVKDGALHHLQIEGQPATFEQQSDNGEQLKAHSLRIEHQANQELTVFIGDAHLERGREQISSERIEYRGSSQALQAGGNSGRVKMVLEPNDGAAQQ